MKIAIETFVTMFFLSIVVIVITILIGSQITVNAATDFHAGIIQRIEDSNFQENVIRQCISLGKKNGYEIEVHINKKEFMQCSGCNYRWEISDVVNCPVCSSQNITLNHVQHEGIVETRYQVKIPILGVEREGVISSNAR